MHAIGKEAVSVTSAETLQFLLKVALTLMSAQIRLRRDHLTANPRNNCASMTLSKLVADMFTSVANCFGKSNTYAHPKHEPVTPATDLVRLRPNPLQAASAC